MKKTYLSALILLAIYSCGSNSQHKTTAPHITINLDLQTDVDSILFCNITQDREFFILPASPTLDITLKDSINDLYEIFFFTPNGNRRGVLWLEGNDITINATYTNKVSIDTVIGSSLYYKAEDYSKRLATLINSGADSITVNDFMLAEMRSNINSPLSLQIAREFYGRNREKKEELQKIHALQLTQSDNIKHHLMNCFTEIDKLLNISKIDLAAFSFLNRENQPVQLTASKGKKYLLDCWFTACPPCVEEHKLIAGKMEIFNRNNIELIGISIDQDPAIWNGYLNEHGYNWQNVREMEGGKKRLTREMSISLYPTYILLDADGKILQRTNTINEILNQLGS